MTGPFADRLFRIAFGLAGIYNLVFGLWAAVWPLAFFELFEIAPPRYPGIWACLGMVVGIYGLLYLYAAWKLEAAWPIIAVGFLGKMLGPIGMVMSFGDDWPRRLGMICVYNDLIWWLPFGLFLIRGTWLAKLLERLAPWICVVTHVAALAALAIWLQPGTLVEPVAQIRAKFVADHSAAWSAGWAIWMAAAVSVTGFYAWWGGYLVPSTENSSAVSRRRKTEAIATIAVVLCALGMVGDFSGEGSAILRLVELSAAGTDRYVDVERQFTLLSPGVANGLYTIGGVLLTMITPGLPRWVRWAMWITWLAGAAMTIAAIFNYVPGLVISTAVLFPPFLCWVAWMGARWRPA
jgi:small multidrug resistance pump